MAFFVDQWGQVRRFEIAPGNDMIKLDDGRVVDVSRHGGRLFASEESAEMFGALWRADPNTAKEEHTKWVKSLLIKDGV